MRSTLFAEGNAEVQSDSLMVLQNPYLLRSRVTPGRDVISMKGAMVAYQGRIDFAHEGSASMGQMLKKMVSTDNAPLMRVSGDGDVFFAVGASQVHLLTLEGPQDGITINGRNLLAFEATLSYDLKRVQGAGMVAGGLLNTTLHGYGTAALLTRGQPVILDCSTQPTYTDINATVAWSTSLVPSVNKSMKAGALIGRGSGEAVQFAFHGPGWVAVQPYESVGGA